MYINDLISKLNEIIPEDTQDDWDNSGRQLGDFNQEIKGVLLCLDLIDETIDYAIEEDINLIISHHPFFFDPIKSLTLDSKKMENLYRLIKNNISVYSLHTNFDKVSGGVSDILANKLDIKKLSSMEDDYGVFGTIEKRRAREFGKDIKERLGIENIIAYGDLEKEIENVSLMGGSGSSFIKRAMELGNDIYISGDIKYHDAMLAMENDLLVFDIGHFSSEFISLYSLRDAITKLADLNVHVLKMSDKYSRRVL